jgi:hypothetical protein
MTGLFLMAAVPGIISENGYVIATTAAVGYLLLDFAVAYLLQIPLIVYQRYTWETISFYGVLILGFVLFVANMYFIQPAARKESGRVVYYLVQEPTIVRLLVGATPLLIAAIVVYMFMREWRRLATTSATSSDNNSAPIVSLDQHKQISHRSFTIALGLAILLVAGIVNFVVYTLAPSGMAFVFAAVLSALSLIIIFRGIELK